MAAINLSILFKLLICSIYLNTFLIKPIILPKYQIEPFLNINSMSQYLKFDTEVYKSLHAHVTKEENDQLIIEAQDPNSILQTVMKSNGRPDHSGSVDP